MICLAHHMHAILSKFRTEELVIKFTDQRHHNNVLKLKKISTKSQRSQKEQGMDKTGEDKKLKTDCIWANLININWVNIFQVYRNLYECTCICDAQESYLFAVFWFRCCP